MQQLAGLQAAPAHLAGRRNETGHPARPTTDPIGIPGDASCLRLAAMRVMVLAALMLANALTPVASPRAPTDPDVAMIEVAGEGAKYWPR